MAMAGTALSRQGRNLPCMATRQMAARKEAGTCSYAGGYLLQRSYYCVSSLRVRSTCYKLRTSVHVLRIHMMPVSAGFNARTACIHRYREINAQYE